MRLQLNRRWRRQYTYVQLIQNYIQKQSTLVAFNLVTEGLCLAISFFFVVLGKTPSNATFPCVEQCTSMFNSAVDGRRFFEHCVTQRRFICNWNATTVPKMSELSSYTNNGAIINNIHKQLLIDTLQALIPSTTSVNTTHRYILNKNI